MFHFISGQSRLNFPKRTTSLLMLDGCRPNHSYSRERVIQSTALLQSVSSGSTTICGKLNMFTWLYHLCCFHLHLWVKPIKTFLDADIEKQISAFRLTVSKNISFQAIWSPEKLCFSQHGAPYTLFTLTSIKRFRKMVSCSFQSSDSDVKQSSLQAESVTKRLTEYLRTQKVLNQRLPFNTNLPPLLMVSLDKH